MILLDTNALIWLSTGDRRARLLRQHARVFVSPASLLELECLIELDRLRLRADSLDAFTADPRWVVDDPPSAAWFREAWSLGWTRDPFDRLLVAHARLRGWRLATADTDLLNRLAPTEMLAL